MNNNLLKIYIKSQSLYIFVIFVVLIVLLGTRRDPVCDLYPYYGNTTGMISGPHPFSWICSPRPVKWFWAGGCGPASMWSLRVESCGRLLEAMAKHSFAHGFYLPFFAWVQCTWPIYLGCAARTMSEDGNLVWYGMVNLIYIFLDCLAKTTLDWLQ